MIRRLFLIIILVLSSAIALVACAQIESNPSMIDLEDSLKEIIASKGEDYDFLEDEFYMSKIKELTDFLIKDKIILPGHIAIGNLSDDTIPEIVVYLKRNPEDVNDQGKLQVYGYDGGKYKLFDEISMNYDNDNYQLAIGKISKDQNGLYVNNQVGANSGVTYGFILQDKRLISILNEKKTNLLSIYTDNEIEDIDKDGVLDFSIYIADPEVAQEDLTDSEKIKLWYKWDGKDSAILTKVENQKEYGSSDKRIFQEAKRLLSSNELDFVTYLIENQEHISPQDNKKLLTKYIENLNKEIEKKSIQINDLFNKNELSLAKDYILNKYSLSLERLNNLEYLNRNKVLETEKDIKDDIIYNLNIGYKLCYSEGNYKYLINYQFFIDNFKDNISKEYRDYLRILALDTNEPYINEGKIVIPLEKLAERISMMENFKRVYPYSSFLDNVNNCYSKYIDSFIFGHKDNPHFDSDTQILDADISKVFQETIEKYPQSYLAEILSSMLEELSLNNDKLKKDAFPG